MLSNLSEGVMYMLLVYWLGPLRRLIEEQPSVAWFVTRFEELQDGMQTLRRNPQAAVEAARAAATKLDLLHDDRLRAIWYGLLALELATEDADERARLKDARERILDRGLKMVNASYVDEAAEADLVMTRIDDDVLRLLAANGFGRGTMFDLFQSWREAGRELGEMDRERTRIEQDIATNARGAYSQLRGEWLRTVKAFRTMVSMLDPLTARLLTEKLDEMEQRADLRVAQRRAESGEAPLSGGVEQDEAMAGEAAPELMPADGTDGRDVDDLDAADLAAEIEAAGDMGEPDAPAVDAPAAEDAEGPGPLRPIR